MEPTVKTMVAYLVPMPLAIFALSFARDWSWMARAALAGGVAACAIGALLWLAHEKKPTLSRLSLAAAVWFVSAAGASLLSDVATSWYRSGTR